MHWVRFMMWCNISALTENRKSIWSENYLYCYLNPKYVCPVVTLVWDICVLPDTHTHTHTRLTAICPGLPEWAGTRKVKPIWILLKQETVSGSGISWDICKSAPRCRQITTPAPHRSVFAGWMPFLPPYQQCQSPLPDTCPPKSPSLKP